MNHLTIIKQMQGDGLSLTLTDEGQIDVAGEAATVDRWLPHIREHKTSIIIALSIATVTDDRRCCTECDNYKSGYCEAARRGEFPDTCLVYRPWLGLPRRCESFINLTDTLIDEG